MRYRKILATIVLIVASSLTLAGCTPDEQVVSEMVNQAEEVDASEAIPTPGIEVEDEEDQQLLDELYRVKDDPLEKDFLEIESQL